MRNTVRIFAVLATFFLAACAGNSMEPPIQGDAYLLEIVNPTDDVLAISMDMGGAVTVIGELKPGARQLYAIPNRGSDEIVLYATAPDGSKFVSEPVDLESDRAVRVTLARGM